MSYRSVCARGHFRIVGRPHPIRVHLKSLPTVTRVVHHRPHPIRVHLKSLSTVTREVHHRPLPIRVCYGCWTPLDHDRLGRGSGGSTKGAELSLDCMAQGHLSVAHAHGI